MLCRVPSALLAPDLLLSSQLLFLFLHLRVRSWTKSRRTWRRMTSCERTGRRRNSDPRSSLQRKTWKMRGWGSGPSTKLKRGGAAWFKAFYPFGDSRAILEGSWDLVSGVINQVTILITTCNPN